MFILVRVCLTLLDSSDPSASTVPSQVPYSSGLWSLEPFYVAIALPTSGSPSQTDVSTLADATEDYVNLKFKELYGQKYIESYITLTNVRYYYMFPSYEFNVLMEFSIHVSYYSGMAGAPVPSREQNFQALKDVLSGDDAMFLSQIVKAQASFSSATAVAVDLASLIKAPSIIPSSVPGSIVPSQIPVVQNPTSAPMASTVPSQIPYSSGLWSLEPFYVAIALPTSGSPSQTDVSTLADATEDYVNLKFKELYGQKYIESYITLTNVRYYYMFPSYEFNVLMEFSIHVSYYSGMAGAPVPSREQNFQALKDVLSGDDAMFLSQIVKAQASFSSATAVAVDLASLIKAPSIIPSSVPGSIVPSQIPVVQNPTSAPMASTVPSQIPYSSGLWSLEPFYVAIALPTSGSPSQTDVSTLADATEDYVNLKFKELYGQKYIESYITLTNVRYYYMFPSYEFNVLMEFSIHVSYYSGMAGAPVPSREQNFQALKDVLSGDDAMFLSQIVKAQASFSSATAVAVDLASLIKAPSIIPSSVPGSIVPSQIPVVQNPTSAPMASTVPSQIPYSSGLWSLEPFYVAIALPTSGSPSQTDVSTLADATEDYVNLKFKELYGQKYIESYITLTNVRYYYMFPSYEFNVLMEFSIHVSYYSGMAGAPVPSREQNFQALKDVLSGDDAMFLSQIVKAQASFSSATAVAVDLASLIKAPSIIPSSVPGSIVPSQIPVVQNPTSAPMASTVPSQIPYSSGLWSLEPFYVAIALSTSGSPSQTDVSTLADATEDYVNLKFKELYGQKYIESYITLTNVRYYYMFPSYEFNVLMEFSIHVSYYSGMAGAPVPSREQNFQALKDVLSGDDAMFLSQIVKAQASFSSATAVAVDLASLIKAPSIIPSSVPGSIVPSQIPVVQNPTSAPMASTVPSQIPYSSGLWSLEPFYLALALPSTSELTEKQVKDFAIAFEDYVNRKFNELYAPKYNGGYITLQKFSHDLQFPSTRFNLLMEFTISVSFFSGMSAGPPIPSKQENFDALMSAISTEFLLQVVRTSTGLGEANEVFLGHTSNIPSATIPPTSAPTSNGCTCAKSSSIDSSLTQSQSAMRMWVQYDMTSFIKATNGYLYYRGSVAKWYKNGNDFGKGKIIIKTHNSMDSKQCGQPLLQTKTSYILFGTVGTEKVPGFAGPTTVFSFNSCAPPRMASSLTRGEWRTLNK